MPDLFGRADSIGLALHEGRGGEGKRIENLSQSFLGL
jgi:hypothetical protein